MTASTSAPSVLDASLMLCDSAVVAESKLFIHGGAWRDVNPPAYPAAMPHIALALTITVPYLQTNGMHRLTLYLEDSDGERQTLGLAPPAAGDPSSVPTPVREMNAEFNIGRPPQLQHGDAQIVPFAVNVDGLVLDKPDSYSFVLAIDGTEIERATFRAHAAPTVFSGM